jgi:AcrR family transcriptional regulator
VEDATGTRRRYSSGRRARQAAQTRIDVLVAATELFAERGWAGTTVSAIAERAGVAVDTVYSGFGSKTGLLAAAKDLAKVGDTDDVPLFDRPGYAELGTGSREEDLRRSAELIAAVNESTRVLDAVWREAAASDPGLAATLRGREAGRRQDLADGLARVLGRPVDDELLDTIWAMTSPEVFAKLRGERQWSLQRYRDWLTELLDRLTA